MVVADILRQMRRSLGEVLVTLGLGTANYTDEYLLEYIEGAGLLLGVLGVTDSAFVVDVNAGTILPEPTTIDGLLLAARASADLVEGDLLASLINGDLGVSFKSGVDEINTTEAARVVKKELASLEQWYSQIKVLKLSKGVNVGVRL